MSNNLTLLEKESIQNKILTIRNKQIMVDRDLAELYGVSTKVLNQAVKRNVQRFPETFRFQFTDDEKKELVTNCDRFEKLKHSTVMPRAGRCLQARKEGRGIFRYHEKEPLGNAGRDRDPENHGNRILR